MLLTVTLLIILGVECTETGSPRRCGGQGDILSGSIATFLSWYHLSPHKCVSLSLPSAPFV